MKNNFKSLGEDVFISEQALIKRPENVSIGNHVAIDNGVTISTMLEIGDYVHIAPNVTFIGGVNSKVLLKDFSFIAAGTCVVAGSEDYTGEGLVGPTIPSQFRSINFSSIQFEPFSGCGVNCSIMPGVTFGEGAILGANSLAVKDLEPWTIYVGSPARPIKKRNKETIINNAKKLGYEFSSSN
jgi:dTDP-4-amino-4,6-dideoxy-D-glucose acyltransferase